MNTLRIALLHLAPRACDVAHNRRLIEQAVTAAADAGASWVVTPELATTGYTFTDTIGTDWIEPAPDLLLRDFCVLARRHGVALFLGHVERDRTSGTMHNSLFTITPDGALLEPHRKINTLRIGSEAWSTPGTATTVVELPPCGKVGLLICADAYSPRIAAELKERGAQVLVSAAAWSPGLHGPDGEWERVTAATGLPLFVCNRTGVEGGMDFTRGESVVAHGGARLLSLASESSVVFVIDWDLTQGRLVSPEPLRITLPDVP
jgi:predicted amidohydrolase